jgi:hypothetical protein
MTRNYRPAAMRASDADRDAVVSDLSEHFQAGRLTAGELDERTGRALTARTWGELGELAADLPALRPAAPAATPAAGRPQPPMPAMSCAAELVDSRVSGRRLRVTGSAWHHQPRLCDIGG